jgi:sugar phosphate isomerase/epimerase
MDRRTFLVGTAASAAAAAGWDLRGGAQGGQAAPPAADGQGAAPARGRVAGPGRGGPANVPPERLARVSFMTGNFSTYTKLPWNKNPTPEQVLTIFDLPKMYVDMYGVHNIEYQHTHLAPSDPAQGPVDGDPAMFKELKAKLDDNRAQMTQINLEFGDQNISTPDAALRQQAIDRTKKWIDNAVMLGCPRVMINQQQNNITPATRAHTVAAWKTMADYGKTKNVKVSAETRGAGTPEQVQQLGMKTWQYMVGIIKDAGAASNVDIGNVAAANQQELHDCIKAWLPYSSGNMHIKSSPNWNIGAAVKYTESLEYKGLYSIEVGTHQAVRIVYNEILAALA